MSAELVDALQWVALAMTVPLFLAPIEPMVRIYKARSVGSFSPAPYLFACVNCLLWIGYALPAITPDRTSPLVTNVYGLVMELIYCGIFIRYAGRARAGVAALFALVTLGPLAFIALCALAIDDVPLPKWPEPNERNASNALGIAAAFFNILMYAAPLSVMRTVIRTRSVEFMPLSLTLTCGLCSTGWTLYALCTHKPTRKPTHKPTHKLTHKHTIDPAILCAKLNALTNSATGKKRGVVNRKHECNSPREHTTDPLNLYADDIRLAMAELLMRPSPRPPRPQRAAGPQMGAAGQRSGVGPPARPAAAEGRTARRRRRRALGATAPDAAQAGRLGCAPSQPHASRSWPPPLRPAAPPSASPRRLAAGLAAHAWAVAVRCQSQLVALAQQPRWCHGQDVGAGRPGIGRRGRHLLADRCWPHSARPAAHAPGLMRAVELSGGLNAGGRSRYKRPALLAVWSSKASGKSR